MLKRSRVDDDDNHANDGDTPLTASIECSLPPCLYVRPRFSNSEEYELHVLTLHSFICKECNKRFPSEKILEIHIDENHNPFFVIQREKGHKIYQCFDCEKKCMDRKKRRLHMIDKHGYPKEYNFRIIDYGIKNV